MEERLLGISLPFSLTLLIHEISPLSVVLVDVPDSITGAASGIWVEDMSGTNKCTVANEASRLVGDSGVFAVPELCCDCSN